MVVLMGTDQTWAQKLLRKAAQRRTPCLLLDIFTADGVPQLNAYTAL